MRRRLPSVKTLESAFPGKGKTLRRLLEDAAAVREHPAAIARQREAYNPHSLSTLRLEALNAEAETCGIEAAWYPGESNCTASPAFEYLNTGDSYAPTIIRWSDGRYRVASVGDIVERGNFS